MDSQDLASTIAEARRRKGWTQKQAAKRSGLPFRTYWAYEKGEIEGPSLEKAQAIAAALGFSLAAVAVAHSEPDAARAAARLENGHADEPIPPLDLSGVPDTPLGEPVGQGEAGGAARRYLVVVLEHGAGEIHIPLGTPELRGDLRMRGTVTLPPAEAESLS